MNDYFQENKRSLLILAGLLLILAVVLYVIVVRPLYKDIHAEENNIESLEEQIAQLEQQLEQSETVTEENIDELLLQNRIPTDRNVDEYILSLQKLESITNSLIESIEFTYDSSIEGLVIEDEEETEEENDQVEELNNEELLDENSNEDNQEQEDSSAEESTDEEAENEKEITINREILEELPENLHVITVTISAYSPTFDDLIEFLRVIENTERISIVTSLSFERPTERDIYRINENALDHIPFEAELTTFYYAK